MMGRSYPYPYQQPYQHQQHRPPRRGILRWLALGFVTLIFCGCLIGGVTLWVLYVQINRSLPSTESLKNYHPSLVSTVYASDGALIGEFYVERRYLAPLSEVPQRTILAFLAAEDARFYEHGGVDLVGIVRAFFKNLQAGEIVQGGSTITQQVVKSLLLTPEKTVIRKVKEAILAYRIDHFLTKDEILYLYLNQIYFGAGAYGVEAAARTYFDKHVHELSLAESSLLAGLPKAPSRFSPYQNLNAARERQQYVLQRMAEVGFITEDEARQAFALRISLARPKKWTLKDMDHFVEEVRRQMEARYGRDGLYKEGLQIYTTLDLRAQDTAKKALDQGLRQLDKRHSRYRGVHVNVPREDWASSLRVIEKTNGDLSQGNVVAALITGRDSKTGGCRLNMGTGTGILPPSGWGWTQVSDKRASRLFREGDVIRVRLEKPQADESWVTVLEQDPAMEGALMAMESATGRVLAMVGGRNFERSQFNRCTQSIRQPGSSFKPVIYAAALDKGYNESSILIDSPLVLDDHSLRGPWKPANYDHQFWGPIPLRRALIHSRNVVTVKLLGSIGVPYTIQYARQLGINSQLTPTLALALGSSGVTMWELITAYGTFANLGERVDPYLIEKIVDRDGSVVEDHVVKRQTVIPPQTAYIMTHLLEGVIEEGTGTRARELGRPAAGKTGTTNELKDAWFIGYTPDVVAGVWVGYDDHHMSLGKGETGGRAACPIWTAFMKELLKDQPVSGFTIPSGIVMARVNAHTGAVSSGDDGVYAAFAGDVPREASGSRGGGGTGAEAADGAGRSSPSATTESFFKSDLF